MKDDDVMGEFRGKFIVHTGHCGKGFRVPGTALNPEFAEFAALGPELSGSEVSPGT